MKPRVAVIFTGGTISMRTDPALGGAVPALSGEEILARMPNLTALADFEVANFGLLPGPHMTPRHMVGLSELVQRAAERPEIDGIVITHGTDTLEETAFVLDLTLDTPTPVALVGALHPSSHPAWDGPANLEAAVRVAASTDAAGLGVLVVMARHVLTAVSATKTHTCNLDTFQDRDGRPLGSVEGETVRVRHRPQRIRQPLLPRIDESVEIVKLSAGSDGRLIDTLIAAGIRGLVIEGLGCGNVPLPAVPAIHRALARGIPLVLCTRCPTGPTQDIYAYEGAGRTLYARGAIPAASLPSHKARLKLMLLLGNGLSLEQFRSAFSASAVELG
jgi:L-asparaginase